MRGDAERSVTRRLFVKGAMTTAIIGAAPPISWPDLAMAQARGGILKISQRTAITRLDPAFVIIGEEFVTTLAIYDNLTRLDSALNVLPSLATEWSTADRGKTWTFNLRKGVTFHDGKPCGADDVVYSVRRILDPATGSPGRKAIGPISEVSAVDQSTVRFALQGPFADFPAILSLTFVRILPKDATELDQKPNGTGPFKFAEWMRGQHIKLARNPRYWMEGHPRVEEVWLITYPALAAEESALRSGETQMMSDVPVSAVSALESIPGIKLTEIASMGYQPICMRSDRRPFNDPRVRRAVKHAINREQVTKFVLQTHGTIASDNPVPAGTVFAASVKPLPYDPNMARNLLKEAGIAPGTNWTLFASNERAGLVELATVVKPMLEAVGVGIQIQQLPWDRFIAEILGKESFFISNWYGRPTIDELLFPYYHSTGSLNECWYSNPELDKLLETARSETDLSVRKQLYTHVQELITTDGPSVIPYFSNLVQANSAKLTGVVPHPLRWMDLRDAALSA